MEVDHVAPGQRDRQCAEPRSSVQHSGARLAVESRAHLAARDRVQGGRDDPRVGERAD